MSKNKMKKIDTLKREDLIDGRYQSYVSEQTDTDECRTEFETAIEDDETLGAEIGGTHITAIFVQEIESMTRPTAYEYVALVKNLATGKIGEGTGYQETPEDSGADAAEEAYKEACRNAGVEHLFEY